MRGVILAYHSQNCGGYDYSSNDHFAFASDLRAVHRQGLPIVSLQAVANCLNGGDNYSLPERFVAFSCDDGTLLDWQDYEHPVFGLQRSFANILRDHVSGLGIDGRHLLTAFVIASPQARQAIDQGCYEGSPLSDDGWWPEAAAEGLLAIENHSWDHLHAVLPAALQQFGNPGDFYSVDDFSRADQQVRVAAEFINRRQHSSGQRTSLFAYPYGHASTYLSGSYFPEHRDEHGVLAAFTTEQSFVEASTQPYLIPRLVSGDAWRTPEQFDDILKRLLESKHKPMCDKA